MTRDIMEIALRRGFIWPSYEIYGGVGGFYDYGPLGATLKKKVEDVWRDFYCVKEGFMEIASPTVSPEEVFVASGHVNSFVDPLIECKKCGMTYRADHVIQEAADMKTEGLSIEELGHVIEENAIKCPNCRGSFGNVGSYNLMFKTHIGPGKKRIGYLRPETAQGMFMLFNRLYSFYRKKLPFGVAQLGRAYRNEISPRQGVIRLREFNQAEVEIFVDPKEKTCENFSSVENSELDLVPQGGKDVRMTASDAVKNGIIAHELLAYQLTIVKEFLSEVGLTGKKVRFRQHEKTEMAHYAADCWDAEIKTGKFGWIEVVGIADRTCFDLEAHEKESGSELKAFKRFEEQKTVKKTVLAPNESRLGPDFKAKAKDIIEVLGEMGGDEIKEFEKNGFIELEINGETIKLDDNYVSKKEIEETLSGEKITPHVIEPSFGIDRIIYCILEDALSERDGKSILNLKNSVAPVEVAIFPLMSKPELERVAMEIHNALKSSGLYSTYDGVDSIGRRYARVDEIGAPYSITVDYDGLEDSTVTIRDRNTAEQKRVKVKELKDVAKGLIEGTLLFENL
jgi:glycyl-tRNA synthetase